MSRLNGAIRGRRMCLLLGALAAAAALGAGSDALQGPPSLDDGAFQVGRVTVTDQWRSISLNRAFRDPVVVAKPATSNDAAPGVVRLRNVSEEGFELRFQEWFYLDDVHAPESVSYLAVERGRWRLLSGREVAAGTVETANSLPLDQPFARVSFRQPFNSLPVVISSVGTFAGEDTVDTRLANVTVKGFEVILQEQESRGGHLPETIHWIAWEIGDGPVRVSEQMGYQAGWMVGVADAFRTFGFERVVPSSSPCFLADIQTFNDPDPANVRIRSLTRLEVALQISEEQSKDPETAHGPEVVGYVVFDCPSAGRGGGGGGHLQLPKLTP